MAEVAAKIKGSDLMAIRDATVNLIANPAGFNAGMDAAAAEGNLARTLTPTGTYPRHPIPAVWEPITRPVSAAVHCGWSVERGDQLRLSVWRVYLHPTKTMVSALVPEVSGPSHGSARPTDVAESASYGATAVTMTSSRRPARRAWSNT
jgi:hypothetical protein